MAARATARPAPDRRQLSTATELAGAAAGGARYGAMIFVIGAAIFHTTNYVGGVVLDHAPKMLRAEVKMNGSFDYSQTPRLPAATGTTPTVDGGADRLDFVGPEAREMPSEQAPPAALPRMIAAASDDIELAIPRISAVNVR